MRARIGVIHVIHLLLIIRDLWALGLRNHCFRARNQIFLLLKTSRSFFSTNQTALKSSIILEVKGVVIVLIEHESVRIGVIQFKCISLNVSILMVWCSFASANWLSPYWYSEANPMPFLLNTTNIQKLKILMI